MDEDNLALNEVVETENNETTTPVVETQTAGEVEQAEDVSADTTEVEPTETEGVKKGYSNRIRELNAEKKRAEAERDSLAARLAELQATPVSGMDYQPQQIDEPIVAAGEEIDAIELDRRLRAREQRILQQADAMATLRARQNDAVNRINAEADKAMRKYPELDPNSDSYNKELSDAVTEATAAYVGKSPYTASVINFVDKMMRPYKGAVSKEVGDMTKQIAKQVSEAASRPTSVREKERPASEKSIAELEAELGMVQA